MGDPGCVVAYPCYHVTEPDGSICDTIRPIEYSPREAVRLHDTVIGPGGLIRRGALEAAGAWSTELRWVGDLILWVRAGFARTREAHSRAARLLATPRRSDDVSAQPGSRPRARPRGGTRDRAAGRRRRRQGRSSRGAAERLHPWLAPRRRLDQPRDRPMGRDRPAGPKTSAWAPASRGPDARRAGRRSRGARARACRGDHRARRAACACARPPGGLEAARELLGRAGVLASDGADSDSESEVADFRGAMMEAAWHCSADSGSERNRFLLIDTTDGTVTQQELEELSSLAWGCSRDVLRAWLAQRTEEIERLRGAGGEYVPPPPARIERPTSRWTLSGLARDAQRQRGADRSHISWSSRKLPGRRTPQRRRLPARWRWGWRSDSVPCWSSSPP